MGIRTIYRDFLQQLQLIYSLNEATIITDWVFERIAGLKRADILINPNQQLEKIIIEQLNDSLRQLIKHRPVQYVVGEAWFCTMKFKVNEQVLIPRPETEELVQLITNDELSIKNKLPLQMLDIGTGSGCIAIALKKKMPGANITAIDVSNEALDVAKENAAGNNTAINFLQLDFLNEDTWNRLPVFDIIVSNPPYIPINEKEKLDKNVTGYEPGNALFVPDNEPLLFYKKIADFGKTHLAANGKVFVETHEDFAQETAHCFLQQYNIAEIIKDIFGKERMVVACNSK